MIKDDSPINQAWIKEYVDQCIKISGTLPHGPMRDSVLRRVDYVMDLVEAWQKRHWPAEQRKHG